MKKLFFLFIITVSTNGLMQAQRTVQQGRILNGNTVIFEHEAGKYADVNGIRIYYEEYGDGEPILMIHGNGGSVETFNNQIAFFSKKFRVIVVDSRGQGKSANNLDSLTYEMLTDDYFLLLDQLKLDSVNVIGFNDGAVIGLMLAINYPQKVKMLAAMGPRLNSDTSAVNKTDLVSINNRIRIVKDSIRAGKINFKPELQLLNLMLHHPDIDSDLLASVQVPVLIMSGDRDMVKLEHTLKIYEQLPMAQLSIFPGSTNAIMQDSPMIFNNTVMRFFTKTHKVSEEGPGKN